MCNPLMIVGLAMTAASVASNTIANAQTTRARTDALAAERMRQGKLDAQADTLNNTARDRYSNFQGQEGQQAKSLADMYTGQSVPPPDASMALPTSSSNVVVNEVAKQRDKAKAFTDRAGTALANLRAFGEALGADSRGSARDASALGQVNDFKNGSSNVFQTELGAAGQSGNGAKSLGDIFGGLGSVALTSGMSGGKLPSLGGLFGSGATTAAATAAPRALYPVAATAAVPRLGALY